MVSENETPARSYRIPKAVTAVVEALGAKGGKTRQSLEIPKGTSCNDAIVRILCHATGVEYVARAPGRPTKAAAEQAPAVAKKNRKRKT